MDEVFGTAQLRVMIAFAQDCRACLRREPTQPLLVTSYSGMRRIADTIKYRNIRRQERRARRGRHLLLDRAAGRDGAAG